MTRDSRSSWTEAHVSKFDPTAWVRANRRVGHHAQEYLRAIGNREMACVKHMQKLPFTLASLCGPGTYPRTREKKIEAIQLYLDLLEAITPSDHAITRPCLWHGDLHSQNIFVDPKNPTTITSIIDWQSAEIAPLFVQVCQPSFLDYEGPQVTGAERPKLRDDFDQLSSDEQRQARKFHTLQSLSALYRKWLQVHHPDAWKAMKFQETQTHNTLLFARYLLVDGEAMYMGLLLKVSEEEGAERVFDPSLLSLTEQKKADIHANVEMSSRAIDLMAQVRDVLGDLFPKRGILVRSEDYDETKEALRQVKEDVIEEYAKTEEDKKEWERVWPWDD